MPKSKLPELIGKALESGLSFRDIRRRSGNKIPLSSLNALHKGRPPNPNLTTETIMALAKGLGESPATVFEAVIGGESKGALDDSMRQLLKEFGELPAKDRNDLRAIIEMLRAEVQKRLDNNA